MGIDGADLRDFLRRDESWNRNELNALTANRPISISAAVSMACGITGENIRNAVQITNSQIIITDILFFTDLRIMKGMNMSGSGFRQTTSQLESTAGCSEKKNRNATTRPPTPCNPKSMASTSQNCLSLYHPKSVMNKTSSNTIHIT